MKPLDPRLPFNPKAFVSDQWYWAVLQDTGLFDFPPTPEGFVMEKLYTVPGCQPDCFKLSKVSEKGGLYVTID